MSACTTIPDVGAVSTANAPSLPLEHSSLSASISDGQNRFLRTCRVSKLVDWLYGPADCWVEDSAPAPASFQRRMAPRRIALTASMLSDSGSSMQGATRRAIAVASAIIASALA